MAAELPELVIAPPDLGPAFSTRQHQPISRFVSPHLRVVTVSAGGSGTTFLMRYLAEHCPCNDPDDRDGLKHFPGPLLPLSSHSRVIYIHSDPVDACVSLFRRGYASIQSQKLTRRLVGHRSPISPQESVETYAARGVDRLGLISHFESWLELPRPYPIAFVQYDSLWAVVPALLDYLNLPARLGEQFPTRLPRDGSSQISHATRSQLETLYGPLRKKMHRLGTFHLSPGSSGPAGLISFLSLGLRAAFPTFSWELSCRRPSWHHGLRRLVLPSPADPDNSG